MQKPSFFRILAALCYDALALFSIWLTATALFIFCLSLNSLTQHLWSFWTYLFFVTYGLFFVYWTKRGQSLGALAWRLRVCQTNGDPLTPKQASLRFAASTLSCLLGGIGHWWIVLDKKNQTLFDRLLRLQLVPFSDTPTG